MALPPLVRDCGLRPDMDPIPPAEPPAAGRGAALIKDAVERKLAEVAETARSLGSLFGGEGGGGQAGGMPGGISDAPGTIL